MALTENNNQLAAPGLRDFAAQGATDIKNLDETQKEIYAIDRKAANLYSALCQKQGNLDRSMPMQKIDVNAYKSGKKGD